MSDLLANAIFNISFEEEKPKTTNLQFEIKILQNKVWIDEKSILFDPNHIMEEVPDQIFAEVPDQIVQEILDEDIQEELYVNSLIITQNFHCNLCNKYFTKHGSFMQHNKTHHGCDMKHKCLQCGKKFASLENLQLHEINHQQAAKKFMCPECPKGYIHKGDLKRHKLSHSTNSKHPFVCHECTKGFTRRDHLENHINSHIRKKLKKDNKEKTTINK